MNDKEIEVTDEFLKVASEKPRFPSDSRFAVGELFDYHSSICGGQT